jgi:hypothetical protein
MSFLLSTAGLFPLVLGWAGLCLLSRELALRDLLGQDWRLSLLLASIGWSALAVVVVEVCSFFQRLDAVPLLVAWMLVSAATLLTWMHLRRQRGGKPWRFRAFAGEAFARWRLLPADVKGIVAFLVLFLGFLGLVGAVFPTSNWDSMTYHLPRVLYWVDQHSVAHFPTENGRQLESGPWSAFVLTNIYLASGTDFYFNALQWVSLLLGVAASGWIALQLLLISSKGKPLDWLVSMRVQAMAMLLAATLPGAVVQSLSTQVDLNTAWWVVCFTAMTLALYQEPRNHTPHAIGAGLALSLAVLTKATSLFFIVPVAAAGGILVVVQLRSLRSVLRLAAIVALCCLALNAPQMARNQAIYHNPLSSHFMRTIQLNKRVSIAGTLSNLVRNLALHTDTGIEPASRWLNLQLKSLHSLAGGPASEADTSYGAVRCRFQRDFPLIDSYAGNFYHLALFLLAGALLLAQPCRNLRLLLYAAPCFFGLLFFCALVRWQPCNARFQLPFFMLLCPWLAIVLGTTLPGWARGLALSGSAVFTLYCLGVNYSCPFLDPQFRNLPREAQMLRLKPEYYAPMAQAAWEIRVAGCERVGLKLGYDGFEYPLMKMLLNRGYAGRIGHAFSEEWSTTIFRNFGYEQELKDARLHDASGLVHCSWQDPDVLVAWSAITLPETIRSRFSSTTACGLLTLYWNLRLSRPNHP